MQVSYQDQTFNTPNPIARYAHRARLRRSIGYAYDLLPNSGRLLDYGCGTGDFLRALKAVRRDTELFGYEPYLSPGTEAFERVTTMNAVADASMDVVTCFEVLEHLSDDDTAIFVREASRVLRPGGTVLVSVPIIGGLTLLLKESNRMLLFRRRSEHTLGELFRASFLGIPAERPANRGPTHKGFDFRATREYLRRVFTGEREYMCPFPALPWWLNSQAFFVLRK